jgi:alanine-synthesizing transaminase
MVISGPKNLTENYGNGIVKLTSMRLCANTLSQIVIPAALNDSETPSSMVRKGGRIFEQRGATVSVLKDVDGISFVRNNSAFYLFAKLDSLTDTSRNDKKRLLEATAFLF